MADAAVSFLLKAKDETAEAFESFKGKLENVKSLLESAFIWRAGEMIFDVAKDGVIDFANSLIGANAGVETLTTSLTALYGNATEAGQAIEFMTKFSLASPFAKDDILAAGQALASVGADITQVLPALGNVAAVMGASLPAAADALDKALQTGSLRGLTTDLHISKAELEAYGLQVSKSGAIVTSTLLPAFEALASAKFSGGMAAQLNTFAGATTNLKNQFDNLAEIAGKPLFQAMEGELKSLVSFLQAHQADVNNFAQMLGAGLGRAATIAGIAFTYIGDAARTFINWWGTSILPAIETVIGLIVIAFGPSGLGRVAGYIGTALGEAAGVIGNQLGIWAGEFSAWLGPALQAFLKSWPTTLGGILDAIVAGKAPLAQRFFEWIVGVLPSLVKGFAQINDAFIVFIAESTTTLMEKMKDLGVAIVQGLMNGIQSMAGALKDKFVSVLESPYDALRSFWKSHSPSMLMFDLGADIGQGLVLGLGSMAPAVTAAANAISAAAMAGFSSLNSPTSSAFAGEVHTSQMGLTPQQIGANVLFGLFGGGSGGDNKGPGGAGGLPAIPPLTMPALPSVPVIAAAATVAVKALVAAGPQLIRGPETGLGDALAGAGTTSGRIARSGAGADTARETHSHLKNIVTELKTANGHLTDMLERAMSTSAPLAMAGGRPIRRTAGF